jgi:O-antigen/teichoic acid export membrane protein
LGPEGKGLFTEIILWPSLVASLSMLGLYTAVVRISAKNNIYSKCNITQSVLYCTIITGIIGIVISIIVNTFCFIGHKCLVIAQVFSIYPLIYSINRGLSAINNGRGDMGIFSISASILNPVYFVCLLILCLLGNITLETALYSLLIANLCSCLFLFCKRNRKSDGKIIRPLKMLRYSIKYSPSDFSEPLYAYYDKVVVAFVLSAYDLGLYTIAYAAAGTISVLSSTFSIKLFSDVARGRTEKLFNYIRLNLFAMFFSSILMCVCLPILIPLVFGQSFAPSIVPSLLLLPVCVLQGQSMIIEKSILAKGYPYIGIKAKAISIGSFFMGSIVLKLLELSSLISISLLLIVVQLVYLEYLCIKMKPILGDDRIVPDMKDIKGYVKRALNICVLK